MRRTHVWARRACLAGTPPAPRALAVCVAAALGMWPAASLAADLFGAVTDDKSGFPLPGAVVTLDLVPADGQPEHSAVASAIGLYVHAQLPGGLYEAKASHPGYAPLVKQVTVGQMASQSFALQPAGGVESYLRVDLQVYDVVSNANLSGATVLVERWASSSTDGPPAESFSYTTDALGRIGTDNLAAGHFRFSVSRVGWEPLVHPVGAPIYLGANHSGVAALKPIPKALGVKVTGYNPVKSAPGPIEEVIVELVGVDFDGQVELVPPRAMPTGKDGACTFVGLPPIAWVLTAKKLGYKPTTQLVQPDAQGGFADVTLPIALQSGTGLQVTLDSPYAHQPIIEKAKLRVEGFAGTPTQGIVRTSGQPVAPQGDGLTLAFENLLPGHYRIDASLDVVVDDTLGLSLWNGALPSNGAFVLKSLPVQTTVEIAEKETRSVSLWLEPMPAIVRGRVLAVDALLGCVKPALSPGADRRVFLHKQVAGIQFVSTLAQPFAILKPAYAVVQVDTDENGFFEVVLPPSLYGIRIPGLPDHAGRSIRVHTTLPGSGAGPPGESVDKGWPSPDPYPFASEGTGEFSAWLNVHAQATTSLDLVLHKHIVQIEGQVQLEGADPFMQVVPRLDPTASGAPDTVPFPWLSTKPDVISLTGPVTLTAPVERQSTPSSYRFCLPAVPPGDYQLAASHPSYTFTAASGQPGPVSLQIPPSPTPGAYPTVDPADPAYVLPGTTVSLSGTSGPTFSAASKLAMSPLTISDQTWDEASQTYVTSTAPRRTFFELAQYPGLLFVPQDKTLAPDDAPYTLYVQLGDSAQGWTANFATLSANAQHTYSVYRGGPQASASPAGKPAFLKESYLLDLHTYTPDGTERVGIPIGFAAPANGQSVASGKVSSAPAMLSLEPVVPEWAVEAVTYTIAKAEPFTVRADVRIQRMMALKGKVTVEAGGPPAAGVKLALKDRFGRLLDALETQADGAFVASVQHQPVFVEIGQLGYAPERVRFEPNTPDGLDIDGALVTLNPLPAPALAAFTIDRHGLFLPGALKSGDTSGFDVDAAKPALTATWQVQGETKPVVTSLDDYDTPEGKGGSSVVSTKDAIALAILFDKRKFPIGKAGSADLAVPVTLPDKVDYAAATTLLDALRGGPQAKPEPFHVVMSRGEPKGNDLFAGALHLWELPAGVLDPAVLVVTRMGAVAIVDYALPSGHKALQGAPLPAWAASLANLIGTVANYKGAFDVSKAVPRGSLIPMPDCQALIDLKDGYLTYEYRVGVTMTEGTSTPGNGLLALGSRLMGLSLGGQLAFKVKGKDEQAEMTGQAMLSKDFAVKGALHLPAFLTAAKGLIKAPAGTELKKLAATGQGWISVVETLGAGKIPEFGLKNTLIGTLDAAVDLDTAPALARIPYVGPFLLAADKAGIAKLRILVEMMTGGKVETLWKTVYPKTQAGYSVTEQPARTHFLGGLETQTVLQFLWRFAGGLRASVLWDSVQAFAKFQIGPPKGLFDPGVKFTFNSDALWPPIKRVEGALSFVGGVKTTAAGVSVSRTFQYDALRIDWQFGTEPFFDLVPSHETVVLHTPFTSDPSQWVGQDGVLVDKVYGAGVQAVASGSGAMAFTQVDEATGTVAIAVCLPVGDVLSPPVQVASSAGVLSLALTRLGAGEHLVAWSEIAPKDLGQLTFSTSIRYVTSAGGGTSWTAPQLLEAQSSAALHLALASTAEGAVLAYVHAATGYQDTHHGLRAATFDGTAWTASQEVHGLDVIETIALSASETQPPHAVLALVDGTGALRAHAWDGATWTPATSVVGADARAMALRHDAGGKAWIAAATSKGDIGLHTLAPGGWSLKGTPVLDGAIARVALLPIEGQQGPLWLLVWVQPGDEDKALYGFLDGDAQWIEGPAEMKLPKTGAIEQLEVAKIVKPEGAQGAAVMIRTRDGQTTSVVEVLVAPGAAPSLPSPSPGAAETQADTDDAANSDAAEATAQGDGQAATDAQSPAQAAGGGGDGGCGACASASTGTDVPIGLALALLWAARVLRRQAARTSRAVKTGRVRSKEVASSEWGTPTDPMDSPHAPPRHAMPGRDARLRQRREPLEEGAEVRLVVVEPEAEAQPVTARVHQHTEIGEAQGPRAGVCEAEREEVARAFEIGGDERSAPERPARCRG